MGVLFPIFLYLKGSERETEMDLSICWFTAGGKDSIQGSRWVAGTQLLDLSPVHISRKLELGQDLNSGTSLWVVGIPSNALTTAPNSCPFWIVFYEGINERTQENSGSPISSDVLILSEQLKLAT